MALSDFILAGMAQMETTLGNPTFIWKGETFICIPNSFSNKVGNSGMTFEKEDDFRLTVRTNQFTPNIFPKPNDYITYSSNRLLVKEVRYPAHNQFIVIVCQDPSVAGL
jgi:hypothetical protein